MSRREDEVARTLSTLHREIDALAPSRVTVLVRGGSAEARAAVAKALHDRSGRRAEPFVAVDGLRLDGDALERRLFGGPLGEPGARGIVREIERGTLHVAAVDRLPLLLQPRFLAFLDGDRQVRVVACAEGDLSAAVEEGRFRADLGERLLLVQLRLPDGYPEMPNG
jgi:DNA-binding NtrC family response regulator